MTNQHPITPPPELVEQWLNNAFKTRLSDGLKIEQVAAQAARWGADQELEACCDLLWLQKFDVVDDLRDARRPKPQSLKEQALAWCNDYIDPDGVIRRALEQLDD